MVSLGPNQVSIQMASLIGLAKKLKTVQFSEILRAKLEVESEKFHSIFYKEKLEPFWRKIAEAQIRIDHLRAEYKTSQQQKLDCQS